MCIPCGPRWKGSPGREAFSTLDDCRFPEERERAKAKYPDNSKALEEIKAFIDKNIKHTEKWIVNELFHKNKLLAYIWAEEENRAPMHKYFLKEKRASNA